ncbi:hypothetical protein R1flu_017467 [Riccia fluitans]|uniref:CBS domain-containing protein n=1 Tax=Riccia fluitans TaxID=41844 RepID=A0ABD1ZH22_9MARC
MAVTLRAGVGIAALSATGATSVDRDVAGGLSLNNRISLKSLHKSFAPNRISVGVRATRSASRVRAAGDGAEVETEVKTSEEGVLPSGEWPENFSLLNFQDLLEHYKPVLFKEEAQPHSILADVMSKKIYTATPEQLLSEVEHYFSDISGLPVINQNLECVGVLSRKDMEKATNGGSATVGDVMSSPAITLSAEKTVSDAAVLMLKNKIHRIPIVNATHQVVGIVTRTDIFHALEGSPEGQ